MSNFKIGQRVICIEGYTQHGDTLEEGKIYTILDISSCKCYTVLYVGFDARTGTQCDNCRTWLSTNKWYHKSSRFKPLDESLAEAVEQMIKEFALEQELIESY